MQKFKVLREHCADGILYSPFGEKNTRLANIDDVKHFISHGTLAPQKAERVATAPKDAKPDLAAADESGAE
jgi:hypothetical protein